MSLRWRIFLTFTAVFVSSGVLSLGVVFLLMDRASGGDNSARAIRLIEPVLRQMRESPDGPDTRVGQNRALLDLYKILAQAPASRRELLLGSMSLFVGFLLLQLLIMVLASAWLSRSITSPLSKLLKGIQAAANRGGSFRMPALAGRELGRIAETFNSLLAELDDKEARLQEQARLAAWQDVAAFLSHQLKNPLAAIDLAIVNVQRLAPRIEHAGPEAASILAESLAVMRAEDQRIVELVNRFRASTTCPEPVLQSLAVSDLLRGVQQRLGVFSITWELDLEPGLRVTADRQLIEEALVNLGTNSVQAWEEQGRSSKAGVFGRPPVTIRFRARLDRSTQDWTILELSDSLQGLPAGLLGRVLHEPFTTKTGSRGLGLVFVRVVTAQHGGTISCRMSPRGGLVFTLRLPSGSRNGLDPSGR